MCCKNQEDSTNAERKHECVKHCEGSLRKEDNKNILFGYCFEISRVQDMYKPCYMQYANISHNELNTCKKDICNLCCSTKFPDLVTDKNVEDCQDECRIKFSLHEQNT